MFASPSPLFDNHSYRCDVANDATKASVSLEVRLQVFSEFAAVRAISSAQRFVRLLVSNLSIAIFLPNTHVAYAAQTAFVIR